MVVIAGATAVGGGDITLVVESDFEYVVLFDVESVTMGCDKHDTEKIPKKVIIIVFFILVLSCYTTSSKIFMGIIL